MGKVCSDCKQEKELDQYETYTNSKTKRNQCYDCLYARRREKYTANPYAFITRMVSQLKSARRKQGHEFDLDDKFFHELYDKQEGKCALTGWEMSWQRRPDRRNERNISIDRINPSGNYEMKNLRLVCKRANLIKHTMTDAELKEWCEAILSTLSSK